MELGPLDPFFGHVGWIHAQNPCCALLGPFGLQLPYCEVLYRGKVKAEDPGRLGSHAISVVNNLLCMNNYNFWPV